MAFKFPIKALSRGLKKGLVPKAPRKPRTCTVRSRLNKDEDQAINDYALALHEIGLPPTYLSFVPLAVKFLKQRGGELKDPKGWAFMFVKRHKDLHHKYMAVKEFDSRSNLEHAQEVYRRLCNLDDSYNFSQNPSKIYSCDAVPFQAERWGADKTTLVNVEMLVAANATGYHLLPPCVVHGEDDYPDFLGMPEVGFVKSSEKKVTAQIMVSQRN